jgi:F-type H+-transporting ATPase subunit b
MSSRLFHSDNFPKLAKFDGFDQKVARTGLLGWALLLALSATIPAFAAAPAQSKSAQPAQSDTRSNSGAQPMTTGSPAEKMDAGATNSQEEGYRHSSTVQLLARTLHVSTERGAQIFEDLNSGLLILAILYFLLKYLPKAFRDRRTKIERDLVDARSATELANQRLRGVEARLTMLDTEIEGIRQQATHASADDQKRIEASLETERQRIIRSAEQEISAAQSAAQRELKRFAADLAVERAMSRIELSADADRVLVHEFTAGLAGQLHAGDFKKRGQN